MAQWFYSCVANKAGVEGGEYLSSDALPAPEFFCFINSPPTNALRVPKPPSRIFQISPSSSGDDFWWLGGGVRGQKIVFEVVHENEKYGIGENIEKKKKWLKK